MAQTSNAEVSLLNSTSDSILDSPHTLKKLYNSLLNIDVVQTGLEKLNKVSAPVIRRLEDSRGTISSKVIDTVLNTTIYNKLADLWLLQNLPYSSNTSSLQEFTNLFEALDKNNKVVYRDLPQIFHSIASSEWRALDKPSFNGIRDALLRTVAKVLNKNLNLNDESLANGLFNVFRASLDKVLANQNKFANQVLETLSESARAKSEDTLREAANEYYQFARRFAFVDYPLRNGTDGWTGLAKSLVKRRGYNISEQSLEFFEAKLDLLMNTVNVTYAGPQTATNLVQRTERILRKLFVLTFHPLKFSSERALKLKDNKYYIAADKRFNLSDKLENALYVSLWGYDVLKERILVPGFQYAQLQIVKGKKSVSYILSGVNSELVRRNISRLLVKYEILRRGSLEYLDQAVQLVLSNDQVKVLGNRLQVELQRLLKELRNLDVERVKENILQTYKALLQRLSKGAHKASDKAIEAVPTAVLTEVVEHVRPKAEEKVEVPVVQPEPEVRREVEPEPRREVEVEVEKKEEVREERREIEIEEKREERVEEPVEVNAGEESPASPQAREENDEENHVEATEEVKSKKSKKKKNKKNKGAAQENGAQESEQIEN